MKDRFISTRKTIGLFAVVLVSASASFAGEDAFLGSCCLEPIALPGVSIDSGDELFDDSESKEDEWSVFPAENKTAREDGFWSLDPVLDCSQKKKGPSRQELDDLQSKIDERGERVGEKLRKARKHLNDLRDQIDSAAESVERNSSFVQSDLNSLDVYDTRRKVRANFASAQSELEDLETEINQTGISDGTGLSSVRSDLDELRSNISSTDTTVKRNLDDLEWKIDELNSPCRCSIVSPERELENATESLDCLGTKIHRTGTRAEFGFEDIGRAVDDATEELSRQNAFENIDCGY